MFNVEEHTLRDRQTDDAKLREIQDSLGECLIDADTGAPTDYCRYSCTLSLVVLITVLS
jgi:hypothetical protein